MYLLSRIDWHIGSTRGLIYKNCIFLAEAFGHSYCVRKSPRETCPAATSNTREFPGTLGGGSLIIVDVIIIIKPGVRPYDAWFDSDNLETTIPDVVEKMLHVDGHETIYAISDRKPQRYGTADTDWQKIRITFDSGSTVVVMLNDELCQDEAIPCTGSRANRTMFAANGTKLKSKGEKQIKAIADDGFPLDCKFSSGVVK